MSTEVYKIKIIRRNLQQSPDDYHATVTRESDGQQLIFISRWRWLLKRKVRLAALDEHFRRYDERLEKLAEVEEITKTRR